MQENPFSKKVHVVVTPCFETDPDSDREYYVSLQMNPLECQLQGESFVRAARRALHDALQGGKISVWNDGNTDPLLSSDPGASQHFMHRMVTPEEIVLTPTRRFADPDGKSLTDFSNDTTISTTIT